MMPETEARRLLQELLDAESTLVLSTAGEAGVLSAPLFYVPGADGTLYWLSAPTSRHSVALAATPQVAVSIFARTFDWEAIRGAQLEGEAAVVGDEAERAGVLARYRERFALPASFEGAIARSALYVFRPRWARYLDNARGFGFRAEVDFGAARSGRRVS